LVSYSAWDSATEHYSDPSILREALDFIAAHAAQVGANDYSPLQGHRNVYLGEFGMPENVYSLDRIQKAIPNAVRTALDWGCPYIVYWQLYCNELKDPKAGGQKTDDRGQRTAPSSVLRPLSSDLRGFWLIRPDGTKAWTWDYFHGLFGATRTFPSR